MGAYLLVPGLLTAEGNNEAADNHHDDIVDRDKQPYLRLSDPFISPCKTHTDPVAQGSSGEQSCQSSNKDIKV